MEDSAHEKLLSLANEVITGKSNQIDFIGKGLKDV
jgi:hypothetical protein